MVQLFHYGAKDPLMTGKEFNIAAAAPVTARELVLSAPYLKSKLQMTLPGNVRQVVFWDGSGQQNSTFEVIYERAILHPKEEAEYRMSMKIL